MQRDGLLQLELSLLDGYQLISTLQMLCQNAYPVQPEITSLVNGHISGMHIFPTNIYIPRGPNEYPHIPILIPVLVPTHGWYYRLI